MDAGVALVSRDDEKRKITKNALVNRVLYLTVPTGFAVENLNGRTFCCTVHCSCTSLVDLVHGNPRTATL